MTCPECSGPMEVDRCCLIVEKTYRSLNRAGADTAILRRRLAAAALCTRCECCLELVAGELPAAERSERS